MNYVAIDFETANQDPSSACALGLARFDDEGRLCDSWYSLIRPPVMYFDPACMAVHHLIPADCRWQPRFCELAGDIISFIGTDPLVAHNAPFDIRVLVSSAAQYSITFPEWEYYCTLAISRKLLPSYRSHSLSYLVSEYLCSEYNAHEAASDAWACGTLFSRLLSQRLYDKKGLDHYLKLKGISYPKRLSSSAKSSLL